MPPYLKHIHYITLWNICSKIAVLQKWVKQTTHANWTIPVW